MDRCNAVIYYTQINLFFLTMLTIIALILNIIPQVNHLAYASTRIIHVGLIFFSMEWLREISTMIIVGKIGGSKRDNQTKSVESLKRICYMLLFFVSQCLLVDLIYLGGVIIYYGCIVTHIILDKGIVFILIIGAIHFSQILVDISLAINYYRSLKLIKACSTN